MTGQSENTTVNKAIASLSLDLDDKWSYMKTHGDPGWESFPSFLDVLVPRVLNFLSDKNVRITVFVVGQDAALERNRELLRSIAAKGHEIGNHSFKHEPWLHLYSEQEIEVELAAAEKNIERATGQRPIGFRGPGYSLSQATLRVLARRGYLYDASTFPSFLIPIARAYYFMTAKFTAEQRRQRAMLGGTFWDGSRPIKPYRWRIGASMLIEIPVTTMPVFKMPIHISYLLCLSVFSRAMALQYFRLALKLCRLTGTEPSLLLHPTDFLDRADTEELSFFPGMSISSAEKMAFVREILDIVSEAFRLVPLRQHALQVVQAHSVPVVEPSFP